MTSPLPLSGIRILDLSRLLPGPYATMLLANLGADVIKVETPRVGDYARSLPPEFGPGMFHMLNRNKRSIGLNYRNKRGREIFKQLVKSADVVFESFKPGAMEKWGFGYEALKSENPKLIYASLSGYGQSGPYKLRGGHDINYMAIGGLLGLNGEAGGGPIVPGVQIADLSGGMFAAMSIMAALMGRDRTGEGAYLDVSMLDAVVSWAMPVAGGMLYDSGKSPQRGRLPLSGGVPCYQVYETADGRHLSLGALEPPFWAAFCDTVERPDWRSRQFDPDIFPEVRERMKEMSLEDWLKRFEGVDACLEPVLTLDETVRNPQLQARDFITGPVPEEGPYPRVKSPIPLPHPAGDTPAPDLGQHTEEILLEAGISANEVTALAEKKVIKVSE